MDHFAAIFSASGLSLVLFVAFLAVDAVIGEHLKPRWQQVSRNFSMIALAGFVMLFHGHGPGSTVLDLRAAAIAVTTLFGGPLVGGLSSLLIASIRVLIGGPALLAGVTGVLAVYLGCLATCHILARRRLGERIRLADVVAVGAVASVIEAFSFVLVPGDSGGHSILAELGPSVTGVQLVSTCLFGWLMLIHLERKTGRRAQALLDIERLALDRGLATAPVDFILKIAMDGRILEANQGYSRRSGYSPDEIRTRNLADLRAPGDDEPIEDFMAHIRHAGTSTYEVRHRTRSGEVWPAEVTSIYDDAGNYILAFMRDVTERKEAERHLAEKSADLQLALVRTIEALSSALAQRDLVSEDHAHRVRDLALRIGRRLGLDDGRLEGLGLAATVHNVGYIRTPAEILNRPRLLGAEERDLIRQHPETGHAILRDISFPWPIADIVLQHHENWDGTGYPAGLVGEEILLDARIIRVADSVAAMTAHRPFRRAHSLDYAMAELSRLSGIWYDPGIVAVCLDLLAHEGYSFPSALRRSA